MTHEYDLVIANGMVIDGTRAPRVRADVAIRDAKVVAMGRIDATKAARVIDATGLNVAPGFVDLHTHYDAQVFWDPYCTLSGWHGVTSVAIGNCGFGFAPVAPDERENAMRSMTRVEAIPYESMRQGLPWDWTTFPEFLDSLDRTPKAVNILPYVPVGPMLVQVLGRDAAKAGVLPTDAQHEELARLLHESMDAGGCGWSAQRLPPTGPAAVQRDWDGTPMPTDVMHDETCLVLARVLAERNQGVVQMTLTTNDVKHDRAHLEEIASISGRPMLHNVVQAIADRPHVHRQALEWLKRCRERGIPVYGQGVTTDAGFTYTFEDWNLYDDSPAWCEATTGTFEERLAKLADPARRQALKDQLPKVATGPLDAVTVLSPKSPGTMQFKEMSVSQVAEMTGHPVAVQSDINGFFQIKPAPIGTIRLVVDGATVTRPGSWVWLQFDLVTIAGQDNGLGRPVRLIARDLTGHSDEALTSAALGEVSKHVGFPIEPTALRMTRWPLAFPQYRPGHAKRVAAIESSLASDAPGVFVSGASYRGIGIPACIHQAKETARAVATFVVGVGN